MRLEEDLLKVYVYLIIPTILLRQLGSQHLFSVQFKVLNMNYGLVQMRMSVTIMYHVPSVMFPPELQLSWFLLKLHVHHPGPESTMATYQLHVNIIIDHHTPALTTLQKLLQGLVEMRIPGHCSTTLLATVLASYVLHMNTAAYSHVLCAQSDHLSAGVIQMALQNSN